jgi:hypothetical protein
MAKTAAQMVTIIDEAIEKAILEGFPASVSMPDGRGISFQSLDQMLLMRDKYAQIAAAQSSAGGGFGSVVARPGRRSS